jgi:hypothetical protein
LTFTPLLDMTPYGVNGTLRTPKVGKMKNKLFAFSYFTTMKANTFIQNWCKSVRLEINITVHIDEISVHVSGKGAVNAVSVQPVFK